MSIALLAAQIALNTVICCELVALIIVLLVSYPRGYP